MPKTPGDPVFIELEKAKSAKEYAVYRTSTDSLEAATAYCFESFYQLVGSLS